MCTFWTIIMLHSVYKMQNQTQERVKNEGLYESPNEVAAQWFRKTSDIQLSNWGSALHCVCATALSAAEKCHRQRRRVNVWLWKECWSPLRTFWSTCCLIVKPQYQPCNTCKQISMKSTYTNTRKMVWKKFKCIWIFYGSMTPPGLHV